MPSRRNSIALTEAEQQEMLKNCKTLMVASNGVHGYPHLVAMWFSVVDGKIHFNTFRKSQKVLNLRRDPKITVMVESGTAYSELKGLVIEGTADIIEDPEYIAYVAEQNRLASAGEPPRGPLVRPAAAPVAPGEPPKRIIIRVNPDNIVSWDHSKLGGTY